MREFLLCMLICCLSHLAFGQLCDSSTVYMSPPLSDYDIEQRELARMDKEVFGRIVWAWEMYEAECWADSTGHLGFWFTRDTDRATTEDDPNPTKWWRDWDSMGFDLERLYNTKAVYRYTHRDPTFPGFMEFLKMKVKP